MKSANRVPVTLRFNRKDIEIMKQIISKEFGPGIRFEHGLRTTLLNTMQAYINQLQLKAKEEQKNELSKTTDSDSSGVSVPNSDSSVLADSGN